MDDCISRQAVLKILKNNRYRFNISQEGNCEGKVLWSEKLIKNDACEEIEQLPSVTPKEKTKWIPVTEDAPQKGTICLWCNKQGSVFTSAITYRSENDSYVGKHGYFSNGLENYGDIVAWMPLPAPYEPQESEG